MFRFYCNCNIECSYRSEFALLINGTEDEDEENEGEDNEAHDKLDGIPEEPIENTETSDTPQLETKDEDPRSQDGDSSKQVENNDAPGLEEEAQTTDNDSEPQSINEESSEFKSEESTSTPEDSVANDSTEAGMEPFTLVVQSIIFTYS